MLLSGKICVLALLLSHYTVSSDKILGLFPYPLKSHYLTFDPLMVALAERGHEVTVFSTFPKETNVKIPNYAEVSLKECFKISSDILTMANMNQVNDEMAIVLAFKNYLPKENDIRNCQPLLDLANSTKQYDLMITEAYFSDFFLTFAHKLNTLVILLRCNTVLPWMSDYAGIPHNPSYIPHLYAGYTTKMNFFQRIKNTFYYLQALYLYKYRSEKVYDQIASDFFGAPMPPLDTLTRNASMLFLNTHFSLNEARPLPPNVIEVGGMNIRPSQKLPKNIEKFINESTHGVIYFSMGSILRGSSFDEKKRKAFLEAFAKLPQRVLWKWEGEFPEKSDNIMNLEWMPQRDILAHSNIKVFISHGGLLGISEAVHEGVPMLGIPIFVDQKHNVRNLEEKGVAEVLEYDDISSSAILAKLRILINDPRYKTKANELSSRLNDRPKTALETAIYWTEYVIEHKGAHHLKTAAIGMPWYQYFLIDVIASVFLIIASVFIVLIYILKLIVSFTRNSLKSQDRPKRRKKQQLIKED